MTTKIYNPYKDYERMNPHRSPRWRYERIVDLVDKRQAPNPTRDDSMVVEGYKFVEAWTKAHDAEDEEDVEDRKRRIFMKWPGLFYSYETYLMPDDDWVGEVIEARILAGQSNEEIADKLCMLPNAIDWYEQLFFNVRDRLKYQDYISRKVIGPLIAAGLQNVASGTTAKYFAYFAGPNVLNYILDGYNAGDARPGQNEDLRPFFEKYVSTNLGARMATSINPLEINKFNFEHLVDIYTKMLDTARRAQQDMGVKTNIEENVNIMLGAIPWSVGKERQEQLDNSKLGDYMGHSVEPRASDMLQIASGEDPLHLAGMMDKQLPPPPKKDKKEKKDEPLQ